MLVVQDMHEETASLDDQRENDSEMKILQASELESELEAVLDEVV